MFVWMSETDAVSYLLDKYGEKRNGEWVNEMAVWTASLLIDDTALLVQGSLGYVLEILVREEGWMRF